MKRLFTGSCLFVCSGILALPLEQPHDLSAMTRNLPSGSHGHHDADSVDLLEHQHEKRTSDSHLRPLELSGLINLYDSPIPDTVAPAYAGNEEHKRFRRAEVLEKGEKKKNYGNYPEKVLNGFAIERKQPVPEGYKGGDPRLSDPQYDDGSEDDVGPYGNRDYYLFPLIHTRKEGKTHEPWRVVAFCLVALMCLLVVSTSS